MHAVTVTASHGVGRQLEQLANFFKGVFMPNLQDNDFALFSRKSGEAAHRRLFLGRFPFASLEPLMRLQLTGQPSPQTSLMIQSPIAKAAQTIVQRFVRRRFLLHQRNEGFLQNIFGLAVIQTQRPAVEKNLRRVRLV